MEREREETRMEGMKEGQSECMTWRRKMASKKGSLNEIKAKASREEEKEGGELKERTFWRGGRKERERRLPRRRVCSFGYGIAGGYAR